MKYAINIPHFGDCADPRLLADLARTAEEAGWDGFFIWDHVALDWPDPVTDVTVALTTIALATERIRFGALVTPLPRRRPVKYAREMVTLDHLSGGRLIAGVGLGIYQAELANLGEPADFKTRAAMLDESLEVLTGLWGGKPWDMNDRFSHEGQYYTVRDMLYWPKPLQQPRIPIWVAAMWPNKAPFQRAARWDGVAPIHREFEERALTPDDVCEIVTYVFRHRPGGEPFDVAVPGSTAGMSRQEAVDYVAAYAEAGATWWQEDLTPIHFGWQWGPPPWPLDQMRARIEAGPPRS